MDELRTGLELATEEELQEITGILFQRRFNPLDYLQVPETMEICSQTRQVWLDLVEKRFRFLAADGFSVLARRTHKITYRQTLLQVCKYLRISCESTLSTIDLEAEIFLNILEKCWHRLPKADRHKLTLRVQRSLAQSNISHPSPVAFQKNPLTLILKGSSAIAVSSVVRPLLLKEIARQFAWYWAKYQIARETVARGSLAASVKFQGYVAMQTARRGMAATAARYGTVNTMLSFLGPALWTWFFADLGWRAIATDYGRIIPIIFALAQIRLTRQEEAYQMA